MIARREPIKIENFVIDMMIMIMMVSKMVSGGLSQ